jgi:hypothetical protein
MISSLMLGIIIIGNLIIEYFLMYFLNKKLVYHGLFNNILSETEKYEWVSILLDKSNFFFKIIDSKFIGLMLFLIANIQTGLINVTINTRYVSTITTFLILSIHSFLITIMPFYFYKKLNSK